VLLPQDADILLEARRQIIAKHAKDLHISSCGVLKRKYQNLVLLLYSSKTHQLWIIILLNLIIG